MPDRPRIRRGTGRREPSRAGHPLLPAPLGPCNTNGVSMSSTVWVDFPFTVSLHALHRCCFSPEMPLQLLFASANRTLSPVLTGFGSCVSTLRAVQHAQFMHAIFLVRFGLGLSPPPAASPSSVSTARFCGDAAAMFSCGGLWMRRRVGGGGATQRGRWSRGGDTRGGGIRCAATRSLALPDILGVGITMDRGEGRHRVCHAPLARLQGIETSLLCGRIHGMCTKAVFTRRATRLDGRVRADGKTRPLSRRHLARKDDRRGFRRCPHVSVGQGGSGAYRRQRHPAAPRS